MIKPILSFVVLILSVIFAFLYVKPEWDLVQEHRGNIVTLDETLQKSSTIEQLINETGQSLKNVPEENLSRFATFLPQTIDDIRLANNIQHLGYTDNVVLENIKVTKEGGVSETTTTTGRGAQDVLSSNKKYNTTKVSFSLTAPYGVFLVFLNDLETSLGLIDVTSLSFALEPNTTGGIITTGPPLYRYTIEAVTYSLQ